MFPSLTFPNHHTSSPACDHGITESLTTTCMIRRRKRRSPSNKSDQQGSQWVGRANDLGEPPSNKAAPRIAFSGLEPVWQWRNDATEWKRYEGKPEPNDIVDLASPGLSNLRKNVPASSHYIFINTDTVGHKQGRTHRKVAASVAEVDAAMAGWWKAFIVSSG